MLDIGWSELLIIAVVAIIVIGPKDLPRVLRNLGRAVGAVRRTAGEFRAQFEDAVRESELDELQREFADVAAMHPAGAIKDAIETSLEPVEPPSAKPRTARKSTKPKPKPKPKQKTRAPKASAAKAKASPAKKPARARAGAKAPRPSRSTAKKPKAP